MSEIPNLTNTDSNELIIAAIRAEELLPTDALIERVKFLHNGKIAGSTVRQARRDLDKKKKAEAAQQRKAAKAAKGAEEAKEAAAGTTAAAA